MTDVSNQDNRVRPLVELAAYLRAQASTTFGEPYNTFMRWAVAAETADAAIQTERVPLTQEQLDACWDKAYHGIPLERIDRFARTVEVAHGIGAAAPAPQESNEYMRGFHDGMKEAPTGECWIKAVNEAMVSAHLGVAGLGVADMSDDYGTAKKKLNALIRWHVEVDREPATTAPDKYCVTVGNGDCISTDPRCMHQVNQVSTGGCLKEVLTGETWTRAKLQPEAAYQSLYEVTRDVCDINTLQVPRLQIRATLGKLGELAARLELLTSERDKLARQVEELEFQRTRIPQAQRIANEAQIGLSRERIIEIKKQVKPSTEAWGETVQFARLLEDEFNALSGSDSDKSGHQLKVVINSYPESNGKRNWTAMFKRQTPWKGLVGTSGGVIIDQGECWNRVAYHAERARAMLGERQTEPDIIQYGKDVSTPEEWTGHDEEGLLKAAALATNRPQ